MSSIRFNNSRIPHSFDDISSGFDISSEILDSFDSSQPLAVSTLALSISESSLEIPVADVTVFVPAGSTFPVTNKYGLFYVHIGSEIILIDGVSNEGPGDRGTLHVATYSPDNGRGCLDSDAADHERGALVQLLVSSGSHTLITSSLSKVQTELLDIFNYTTGHDHSGSMKGAQIPTAGLQNNAVTAQKIATSAVTPSKLLTTNSPTDDYFLKYNAATQRFKWGEGSAGGFDSTSVNDTTWGDSTEATITWTYDVSVGTSPYISFSDETVQIGATSTVVASLLSGYTFVPGSIIISDGGNPTATAVTLTYGGTQDYSLIFPTGQSAANDNITVCSTGGQLAFKSAATLGLYKSGGTDVALADGGTGASLTDPNADRIMFWDDSAGAVTWLTLGTNLTITDTTLDAASSANAAGNDTEVQFNDGGTALGGDAGFTYNKTTNTATLGNLIISDTGGIQTSTSAGNTALLQAYDVDGAAYVTFGTLTANNTPTFDLASSTTIGTAYPYRVGGTDVSLADGGTGASLTDPNADRILFWDDSAGAVTWLTVGTNLTITDTTIDAAGGSGWDGTTALQTTNGASIDSGTSANDTFKLRGRATTGGLWIDMLTLTSAALAPTLDFPTGATWNSNYIYHATGTDVPLTDGGTGASTAAGALLNITGWTISQVSGSDFTTTSTTLVDITGLSFAASANTLYEFEAFLKVNSNSGVAGVRYGLGYSAEGATVVANIIGTSNAITSASNSGFGALNTESSNVYLTASNLTGYCIIKGFLAVGANAGNFTVKILKVTSQTATVYIGSMLKVRVAGT